MRQKILPGAVLTVVGLFCLLAFGVATHAQEERVTLTTYYPAPFGVYQILRLFPTTGICTGNGLCPRPGEMCYSNTDNRMYICGGAAPSRWRQITDLWDISPADPNSIYSVSSGNVGIGTNIPTAKLDVRGTTNICVRQFYTPTSGMTTCPPGYGLTRSAGPGPPSGFFMCCRHCGIPDFDANGIC